MSSDNHKLGFYIGVVVVSLIALAIAKGFPLLELLRLDKIRDSLFHKKNIVVEELGGGGQADKPSWLFLTEAEIEGADSDHLYFKEEFEGRSPDVPESPLEEDGYILLQAAFGRIKDRFAKDIRADVHTEIFFQQWFDTLLSSKNKPLPSSEFYWIKRRPEGESVTDVTETWTKYKLLRISPKALAQWMASSLDECLNEEGAQKPDSEVQKTISSLKRGLEDGSILRR